MVDLCQYSDIFGKPGEGIHKWRLGRFAAADVILTFILWLILVSLLNFSPIYSAIGLVGAGIIVHRAFCVDTALNKMIFN